MKTRNFMQQKFVNVKELLPGLIVCIIIGLISKYVGTFVPALGGATIAILLGLLLGNTVLTHKSFYKRGFVFQNLTYFLTLLFY